MSRSHCVKKLINKWLFSIQKSFWRHPCLIHTGSCVTIMTRFWRILYISTVLYKNYLEFITTQTMVLTTHLLSIERANWPKLHDMFKARDANVWQRESQVRFPVEISAINSIFINIFMMLLLVKRKYAWLKQNMSCWSVNSFDFALKKIFPA